MLQILLILRFIAIIATLLRLPHYYAAICHALLSIAATRFIFAADARRRYASAAMLRDS